MFAGLLKDFNIKKLATYYNKSKFIVCLSGYLLYFKTIMLILTAAISGSIKDRYKRNHKKFCRHLTLTDLNN